MFKLRLPKLYYKLSYCLLPQYFNCYRDIIEKQPPRVLRQHIIHQPMIKRVYAECSPLFQLIKLLNNMRTDPTDVIFELYRKRSTTVFVTFLDASKAFDRLDHWLLFIKLIKCKVPLFIVRLLIVWYSLQRMHIRWGNTFSTSFCVSNGVKQGGIISPVLFNVYMDDLSCALNRSNIGGRIGSEIVNHLSYADDLCLICLSSAGMQKLLNVCSNYATEHSLSYNANKSYSLCFNPIRSGGGL